MSGKSMSGADTVIQVLADEGVDTIFGYSGGAILPIYDAVFRYNDKNKRADGSAAIPLIVPCLLYTSPSPRDVEESRMPSSA